MTPVNRIFNDLAKAVKFFPKGGLQQRAYWKSLLDLAVAQKENSIDGKKTEKETLIIPVIKKLRLERFKSFKNTEIQLSPFTVLLGVNASGKSNIRDAFRFLRGIWDSVGQKRSNSFLQWRGTGITFQGSETFALEVTFLSPPNSEGKQEEMLYRIEVAPGKTEIPFRLVAESLIFVENAKSLFDVKYRDDDSTDFLSLEIGGQKITEAEWRDSDFRAINYVSILLMIGVGNINPIIPPFLRDVCWNILVAFRGLRFFNLEPDAMRIPSVPGQNNLGDRGENLSSVLQKICENSQRKQALLQSLQKLTPMGALDFEFPTDFTGKTLVTLVESNGQKTSAINASDGTLRFLAIMAALLYPEKAPFYFFEEIETGIHPTRLHLLIQLIEKCINKGDRQVVATTHSPQLLRLLSPESLESASLIYRLEERSESRIIRILDIPTAKTVFEENDLAELYESAWFENVMEFMSDEEK
ncbi:MAG: AAA family ATPase [Oscillatoria sp. SIO1A7]|nr:AAA family ATPase [Oscillatoria sp. SIO1A7]